MYIYCQAITVPCALAMMFYCNSENFAGVNMPYPVSTIPVRLQPDRILVPEDLQMKCNEKCSCDLKDFSPICDKSENIMYYSACTAGCLNQQTIGKFKWQCAYRRQNEFTHPIGKGIQPLWLVDRVLSGTGMKLHTCTLGIFFVYTLALSMSIFEKKSHPIRPVEDLKLCLDFLCNVRIT